MTARSGTRWGPVLAASGWLLIGVGVLCNEWLLARFSQDGVLRSDTKWLIRGFELIALAAGMLLLVARRSPLLRKVVCGALMRRPSQCRKTFPDFLLAKIPHLPVHIAQDIPAFRHENPALLIELRTERASILNMMKPIWICWFIEFIRHR